jgi:hypothetical protein
LGSLKLQQLEFDEKAGEASNFRGFLIEKAFRGAFQTSF